MVRAVLEGVGAYCGPLNVENVEIAKRALLGHLGLEHAVMAVACPGRAALQTVVAGKPALPLGAV